MLIENVKGDKAGLVKKAFQFAAGRLGIDHRRVKARFAILESEGEFSIPSGQIWIDKTIEGDLLISTIFHEMTHLMQKLDGRLAMVGWKVFYQGNVVEGGYWNQPHEIEARAMAKQLLADWKNQ